MDRDPRLVRGSRRFGKWCQAPFRVGVHLRPVARFFPSTPDATRPPGEKLFREQLERALEGVDYDVYCTFLFSKKKGGTRELDFIILDRRRGLLCIEVKGGPYGLDAATGKWGWFLANGFSADGDGSSAFEQCVTASHELKKAVCRRFQWREKEPPFRFSSCVALPATDFDTPPREADASVYALSPTCNDPAALRAWIDARLHDLRTRFPALDEGHADVIEVMERGWLRPNCVPRLRLPVEVERDRTLEPYLVSPAIHAIDAAAEMRRVHVEGGAGTGKTFAAVRRALRERARLLDAGVREPRVLVTCYNEYLAEVIAERMLLSEPYIEVRTFHSLAESLLRGAGIAVPAPEARDQAYYSSLESAFAARANAGALPRFDAIVIDEAQDFLPQWLDTLCDALLAPDGSLCAFHDSSQVLYEGRDAGYLRRKLGTPLVLTRNLRNTQQIARFLQRFGFDRNHPDALPDESRSGPEPVVRTYAAGADEATAQLATMDEILTNLLSNEELRPREIVLLSPFQRANTCLSGIRELCGMRLARAKEYPAGADPDEFLRYETLHSFKGAESAAVILHDVRPSSRNISVRAEALYTACSRATHALYVLHRDDFDFPKAREAADPTSPTELKGALT